MWHWANIIYQAKSTNKLNQDELQNELLSEKVINWQTYWPQQNTQHTNQTSQQ